MSESSLSLQYNDFAGEVGHYLSYKRDNSAFTTDQTNDVNSVIDRGYRKFLSAHNWHFLWPTATITTIADTATYTLPDNFGSLRGRFSFAADTSYPELRIVSESMIRELNAGNSSSSIPSMASIQIVNATSTTGQRFEVTLWNTPNAVFVFTYTYNTLVSSQIRAATPYPLGGMAHSQTLLYAMLSEAEVMETNELGIHNTTYLSYLAKSIDEDNKLGPQFFGKNLDRSDDYRVHFHRSVAPLYEGSEY